MDDQINTGCAIVAEGVEYHRAGQGVDRLPADAICLTGTPVLASGTTRNSYCSLIYSIWSGLSTIGIVAGHAVGAFGALG